MYHFTQQKFQSFPQRQQHKKCAELLRHIYDCFVGNQAFQEALEQYNLLQKWMLQSPFTTLNHKSLADAYHDHLQKANVHIRENNLLPHVRTGDKPSSSEILPIAIYLDNTRSAFNVGSILRTTEAFSLGSVYFGEKTPYIDNRQVQNTSMDAYRWIPCHKNIQVEQLPRPIIAMETCSDAIPINEFIFPESFTLILGNEEYGCSENSLKTADLFIEIPLWGKKNSLNVANAFAIAANEIRRQHHKKKVLNEKF